MKTIRNAFLTVFAILSLSAMVASCALDDAQATPDQVGASAQAHRTLALTSLEGEETQADNRWREEFDCVGDGGGIICTSEELDLVVWCDYASGKCGGGCLRCN